MWNSIVSVPDHYLLSTLKADNLRKHMLVHSKEKPYIFYACGKQFREPGKIKRHLLIHTGEKPYGCEIRRKEFNTTSNLKTHNLAISWEKAVPLAFHLCCFYFGAVLAVDVPFPFGV